MPGRVGVRNIPGKTAMRLPLLAFLLLLTAPAAAPTIGEQREAMLFWPQAQREAGGSPIPDCGLDLGMRKHVAPLVKAPSLGNR